MTEIDQNITTELEGHVTKHRRQIEELLATIDAKDALIGQVRRENDELKKAVNSIYAYLSHGIFDSDFFGIFGIFSNFLELSLTFLEFLNYPAKTVPSKRNYSAVSRPRLRTAK